MNWMPATSFHRNRWALLSLGAAAGLGGTAMLFLHLMQNSAPFAEAVAKISPDLANTFSCTCPFCSAACEPPADQQGLARFDKMLNVR
ncbi:MAG: hypothetical protein EON60_08485 [Alphaproteobacteria bacterium]|nr:MAG: hypothetical protein EON60_08485 [Alphaproteobacteria bacterium]